MAKRKNKRSLKPVVEEKFIGPTELNACPAEFFKKLSPDDQDDILRMIIYEGGVDRLLSVIQSTDTPGAVDLFLDQVQYFHFLPTVRENIYQD
jgi:hypothetical protein